MEIPCPVCGLLFNSIGPSYHKRKFCSIGCSNKNRIKIKDKEKYTKKYHAQYRNKNKERISKQKRIYNSRRKYGEYVEAHMVLLKFKHVLKEEIQNGT